MKYYKTKYGSIINENNETIPMDESSELYKDYVDFLKNDGIVEDTEFITDEDKINIQVVPETVTRRQLRQALILSDFDLSIIDNFINSVEDEKERLILDNYWNASTEFERNHPILIDFSNKLNFTTEQTNDLFILANTL
jgi:hypothetical protein